MIGHRPARQRMMIVVGAALLTAGAAVAAWWWQRHRDRPPADVARWVDASPYRNVRPGVKYVGDAACDRCHPSQAETYHRHPMGRSFAPVAHDDGLERYDRAAHNPFEARGMEFSVERSPNGVRHKAVRRDADNRAAAEVADSVAYSMGSGTRGRSYLIDRGGYLFQSPISWYTQKNAWDLSPMFERIYPPDRVVEVACVFCHTNSANWVAGSRNHYHKPVFQGHAIGCERCHGPGELHVALREPGGEPPGRDDTIVNPRHLEPDLREAVCQQCHLQGEQRVLRGDHSPFDFRPGLPIHPFWSVFVWSTGAGDTRRALGQVEQMYASRCFTASTGKLGCISCHDPHVKPADGERVAYFRERCQSCHETKGCAVPEPQRRRQQADDSCMACHMPRLSSANVAHTAVTDHRILRRPSEDKRPAPRAFEPAPSAIPIANFFEHQRNPNDTNAARDLGVALVHVAQDMTPLRRLLCQAALPELDQGLSAAPDDAVALEARGFALAAQGRTEEARAALDAALRAAPTREITISLAAQLAQKTGRPDDAAALMRRAIDINPWDFDYRFNLAQLLAGRGAWAEAWAEADAAMRLNPFHDKARKVLVACCLRTGRKVQADKEFAKLLALSPSDQSQLRDWYVREARGE